MTVKGWLIRHTTSPSDYAHNYASGLEDLAEYLASSLVVFSGKRHTSETPVDSKLAFENHFDMESAGFDPVTKDIADLAAPSLSTMVNESLFNSAYQVAVAFLCLYSGDAAHRTMQPENAEQFSLALNSSVAKMSAGRFGLHPEPRNAFRTIRQLFSGLPCQRMLNMESFGQDDGLGAILNQLSVSQDRLTRYAFVVGSKKQPLGCAPQLIKVIVEINDKVKRCAEDAGW
jgi:hypothetical protein